MRLQEHEAAGASRLRNILKKENRIMKKVFIDGSAGTTGLRINERFESRDDIELMHIDETKRKDPEEIKKYINESDITFLCLPDDAAREAVGYVENENTVIIDTSTAHRTDPDWAYGFPELSDEFEEKIKISKRIAVPGCYASGFIALAYPLVKGGLISADYPAAVFAASGYSGGGKKLIAAYEEEGREAKYDSARMYAWGQSHKHLREMKAITGLNKEPVFSPFTTNYHSGMIVQFPIFGDLMEKRMTPSALRDYFAEFYDGKKFIKVMPFGADVDAGGALFSDACAGWDGMEIFVCGNSDRLMIGSRFDNLGKGASGAAIECMNISMGADPAKGLNL